MNESTVVITDTSKSITAIKELLKSVNIRKIIYVDDKFDIEYQKESIIASLVEQRNQGQKTEGLGINWELPEAAFSKHLQDTWSQWMPHKKKNVFRKSVHKIMI